jgi:uncharacterized membrane protein
MKIKILPKIFLSLAAGFAALFTLRVSASTAFSLTFTTIDVPGATHTSANRINARGQIVGGYIDARGTGHGFLLDNGTFTLIDFPVGLATDALGINAAGQIVGRYLHASSLFHGFLLDKGTFTTIDPPGSTFTEAIVSVQAFFGIYLDTERRTI